MTDVDSILEERAKTYGAFEDFAEISQALKAHIHKHGARLAPDQKEALEMIMHKAARILNGNPDYLDSWHDISGYAALVAERLQIRQIKG